MGHCFMPKFFAVPAFAWLVISAAFNAALAQQPTQAQREAIRESCRSDFMANCSNTEPGGKDALECLMRNDAKLSAACKTAVEAVAPAPAAPTVSPTSAASAAPAAASPTPQPAAAQSQEDQLKLVRQTCTLNDFAAHCSWIAPSSPELLLCLKANAAELSPACQKVVEALPAAAKPAATAAPPAEISRPASPSTKPVSTPKPVRTSAPSSPAPAQTATAAKKPTSQQLGAIRAACRSDFMAHCSGVQPGGAAALQCLQKNSTLLSAACHSAVAAIDRNAPTSHSAAPAATPAAPAIASLGPMPPMRPRMALAILRICDADQRSLCSGVEPGAGRLISCLSENAASLSPRCYAALSAAARR